MAGDGWGGLRRTVALTAVVAVWLLGVGAAGGGAGASPERAAAGATTVRVSVNSSEQQADKASSSAALSSNGRYVAFASNASNLVADDTNDTTDVFVRDRKLGVTERVSVNSREQQADLFSVDPSISADGRYVAYTSEASNLVVGDTNRRLDVFVRDRKLGVTERVSVNSREQQAHASVDGSTDPSISADGRYVAFESGASNLVVGDTNRRLDVFVRDRKLGVTQRVSVNSREQQATGGISITPAISATGRYVAYTSGASNLVAHDTKPYGGVFVRDRKLGLTERVSVNSHEQQADAESLTPAISATGRYVAYTSGASNLVAHDTNHTYDVFVRDRELGLTRRVSVSSREQQAHSARFDGSTYPSISANGRYVAFEAHASNLVAHDTNHRDDVFVRDRKLGLTRRVSVSSREQQATGSSSRPSISAGGRYVAFDSGASNLVARDTNRKYDVFVRDRQ